MEVKNYTLRLHGLEIIEKSYFAIAPPPENQEFNFDFNAKAGVDPDRKLVIILIELSVRKIDDQNVLSKLTTATAFEMPNLEQDLIKQENGQYGVPPELDTMFKSIALSTARGILFSELRGTPLHRAILPLIQLPVAQPILMQPEPAN
jgi:hypothetical protein